MSGEPVHDQRHRQIERLRADRVVLVEAAAVVRAAPGRRWAGISDSHTAEHVASLLEFLAERLDAAPDPDRDHVVRVARELVGRGMDRPAVRRTRRR